MRSNMLTCSCSVAVTCFMDHPLPGHQEEAVEEFRKALQIRESLFTPDDRRIAEWCVV